MSRIIVAVLLVFSLTVFAAAAETAPAPAAKPAAGASQPAALASTASKLPAALASTGSGAAQAAPSLTSEDVLKKSAEAYKAAKTYYEESHSSMSADIGGKQMKQEMRLTVAFKRPGTVKLEMSGPENITVFSDAGDTTILFRDRNQYMKRPGLTPALLAKGFPAAGMAMSDDPYSFVTEGVTKVSDLKTADFEGRQVYEIDYEQQDGATVFSYFDKAKFNLVGLKMEMNLDSQEAPGKAEMTLIVDKALFDEMPKDASGKETDALSFTLPEGATEMAMPRMPPAQPQGPGPSSDSGSVP